MCYRISEMSHDGSYHNCCSQKFEQRIKRKKKLQCVYSDTGLVGVECF